MLNLNKDSASSPRRKLVNTAAVTLALAGGGIAGAVVGAPLISSAQSDDTTATTEDTTATTDATAPTDDTTATDETTKSNDAKTSDNGDGERCDGPRMGHHGPGDGFAVETITDLLGIEASDLFDALRDGKTLAEVAEDNGVSTDELVTALVDEAEARIDERVTDGDLTADEAAELKADLQDRITDRVNAELGEFGPRMGHHGPGDGVAIETITDLLGIEVSDLFDALRDGKTLAEVAEDNGVSTDELVTALVDEAEARIDERVTDGDLTADEAADLKADLQDRITERVNAEPGEFGPGLGRGGGPRFGHDDGPWFGRGPGRFDDRSNDEDETGNPDADASTDSTLPADDGS